MLKISSSLEISTTAKARANAAYTQFLGRTDIGFPQILTRQELWDSSLKLGVELRRFKHMVIVGMGGSTMGARVIAQAWQGQSAHHTLHVCDNVDEFEFEQLLLRLGDLRNVCWIGVSKSGSTIETVLTIEIVAQMYQQQNLPLSAHIAVVTEQRPSPLFNFAQQHRLATLAVPFDVGGRFSVLTPVGLLPAAFLGVDIAQLQLGAQDALGQRELIEQMVAATLDSFSRDQWITMFWSYCSGLREFGGWISQLWAESLAKKQDRTGAAAARASTPLTAVGASDQHSLLQQVMEGARDKFVVFHRVASSESVRRPLKKSQIPDFAFLQGKSMGELLAAEAQATADALTKVGVSNVSLCMSDLGPRSLGELFMFWQMVVAVIGEALNVDAFDQPGVELGKRLARDLLKGQH